MIYLLSGAQICVYSITYFIMKAYIEYFFQGAPCHSNSSQHVTDTSDGIHKGNVTGRKMNSVPKQKGQCQGVRHSVNSHLHIL